MRIAYLTAGAGVPVFGHNGASVHIREFVKALADLGHDVTILAARRGKPEAGCGTRIVEVRNPPSWWHLVAVVGRRRVRRRAREELSIRASAAILERLRQLHARERFDLIYERYTLWSVAGVRAAYELRIPCILEVNAPLVVEQQRYRNLILTAHAEAIEAEVLSGAHSVVAVSEPVRHYVLTKGASPEKAIVLSNGVDLTRFHPAVEPETLDGIGGKFIIGWIGSFKPWHGLEMLLEAFRTLATRSSAYHLLLVGDGPRRTWAEDTIRRLGLASRVTMTGSVPHGRIPRLIQRMDVAVAPAPALDDFYFSPLKLFEYIAVGKPVVASRIGQIQDVVTDGRTGLLIPPGDQGELAAAIERLREDPELRMRLGAAASEAARHYTWERNARRVTALAEDLLKARGLASGNGQRPSLRHPYVFVVGCPRSGTTLLQRMLDHHPLLAVANDTHFIPEGLRGRDDEADPPLTPEIVERVRRFRFFPSLRLPDRAVEAAAAASRTYGGFVSALYVEYGRMRGKPLAGDKTPDYCKHLPLLHCLFPWVKTIHLIRDGRDVVLSTLEWAHPTRGPGRFRLWEEHPIAVCALWWRWQVSTGRRDGAALGPGRYLEVRYEELVRQPEPTLRRLAAFLELPYSPQMLAYHVGKVRRKPGLSAKEAWLPPTPGLRDWRIQMSKRDIELFEALAGDLLDELGYERTVQRISPDVAALAERCKRWWEAEIAWRERASAQHKQQVRAQPSGQDRLPPIHAQPIFILGNQRSGTTAIAALLAQLTGLSVTLDLPREDAGAIYPQIRAGQVPFEQLIQAERIGFSRDIIKEPHLTVFYEELARRFPQARFVFIVRDPRETIRSILNRLDLPGHLAHLGEVLFTSDGETMRRWRLVLENQWLGLNGGTYIEQLAARWAYTANVYLAHPQQMVLIRYEEFLRDKVGAITRLAQQLGLPARHDIRDMVDVQYQRRGDHSASWEAFFGPENLRRIEVICRDQMARLGYPLTAHG
jgi:glycosyltransferase involved in cell wall biosynthesis